MARRALQGRHAIVTGCSSGIGRAIALRLTGAGVHVIATARRQDRLDALRHECESRAGTLIPCAGDITDEQLQTRLIELAQEQWGSLDILINNAGVGAFGSFQESAHDNTRRMFEVNVLAPADLMRRSLSLLTNGRDPIIVNVGSVLGHFPVPLKAEYCATKAALRALSNAVRMEFRTHGVDVLLVSPSTTDSEFFDQTLNDSARLNWKRFGAISPDYVASRTLDAIRKGRRELFLGKGARCLTFAYRWFPRMTERILKRDAAFVPPIANAAAQADGPTSDE